MLPRQQFVQQPKALSDQCDVIERHTRHGRGRLVEALHKLELNRIVTDRKHDGGCDAGSLDGQRRLISVGKDQIYPASLKIGGQRWQAIIRAVRPKKFQLDLVFFDNPVPGEPAPEGGFASSRSAPYCRDSL